MMTVRVVAVIAAVRAAAVVTVDVEHPLVVVRRRHKQHPRKRDSLEHWCHLEETGIKTRSKKMVIRQLLSFVMISSRTRKVIKRVQPWSSPRPKKIRKRKNEIRMLKIVWSSVMVSKGIIVPFPWKRLPSKLNIQMEVSKPLRKFEWYVLMDQLKRLPPPIKPKNDPIGKNRNNKNTRP